MFPHKTKKKILIALVTFVAVAILTGVAFLSQRDTTVRATTVGSRVDIDPSGGSIYYGVNERVTWKPWSTKWYKITSGSKTYWGTCLEPEDNSPDTTGTVSTYSSQDIIRVMLVTNRYLNQGSVNYYDLFKNSYDWGSAAANITNLRTVDTNIGSASDGNVTKNEYAQYYYGCNWYATGCPTETAPWADLSRSLVSAENYIFAMGHMMAGRIYNNDTYALNSSDTSQLTSTLNAINSWFNRNYPNGTDGYTLYTATPNDGSLQTVGWLEYTEPTPTRIRICKKSTTGDNLSGAGFTVNGTLYTTGSNGCTSWITVNPGTVSYVETSAPSGYRGYSGTQTCTAAANTDTTCNAQPNTKIAQAKVKIKKVAADSSSVTYAGQTVVGTTFNIYNSSNSVVGTITIGNDGTGTSGWISEGTYTIKENQVTAAFIKDTSVSLQFTVSSSDDGRTIDLTTSSTACSGAATSACWFKNAIKKGKVSITKLYSSYGENDKPLAGVTFNLVNKADSSITGTLGPTDASGNATSGNLPYGEYQATEVRSTANEAFNLLTFDFSITANGTTVSGGNQVNQIPDNPSMPTVARNSSSPANNPDKEIEISPTAGVTDDVSYSGLVAGHAYKLRGELYEISSHTLIGTKETQFTAATGGSGHVDVVFDPFDSSNYRDKTLGIIQYLYKKNDSTWVPIFTHNADLTDTNQMVKVKNIEISSVATTERTDNKVLAAGTVKILEAINITGLTNGQSYVITATVKDPSGNVVATKDVNYSMTSATGATVTVNTNFEIDSTPYVGKKLSVYIVLKHSNGTQLATHNPPSDNSETVTVITPQIGTSAVNGRDNSERELEVGETTIKDTVTYTGLVAGNSYTIKGEVWKLKADGTKDVKVSEQQKSFTATGENNTSPGETLTFNIDTIAKCAVDNRLTLPCKFVVFEYIYFGSSTSPFAKHEDVADTNQIVSVKQPTLQTAATDIQNDTKFLPVGTTTVMDKVTYSGLVPGQTYVLKGKLIDLSTGNVVKNANNVEVTSIDSFPASGVTGTVTIDNFSTFDSTLDYDYSLGENQRKYVVYQTLYFGDVILVTHEESGDESQTVQLAPPKIRTKATYKPDGSNMLGVGDVTMKDYVEYEGLVEGEWYMIEGAMIDPETGQIVEIDDEFVRNTKTFKADVGGKGTVALEINLNTIPLQGRKFIVYERLYRSETKHGDGRLLAVHEEALDEGEQTITVKIAKIETTAKDKSDNDNVLKHEDGQTIVDTIHYDGLLMGEDYILYGFLWNKTANEPLLDANGNLISATADFTTSTRIDNGDIEMEFNVDANDLPGVEIVVYEYLFQGTSIPLDEDNNPDLTKVVTKHDDPESISQTVRVTMRVGTTAADAYDGDQTIGVGLAKVIDKLKYEGVTIGKTYKAKGWLVDAETGEKVQGVIVTCTGAPEEENNENNNENNNEDNNEEGGEEGEEGGEGEEGEEDEEEEPTEIEVTCTREHYDIEGTETFVAGSEGYEETTGFVIITFEFDSRELIGKKLVVYEELYLVNDDETEELVAEHKDINDEEQTITVADPVIHTTAMDKSDLDKELMNDIEAVILDKVEYSGLIPGTKYTLHGYLVNKETGERVTASGNTEVSWEFTATRDAGEETIEFTIDTTGLSGKEIVVFEELYIDIYNQEEDKIAEHKDINDNSQTVWVKVTTPDTGHFTRMLDEVKQARLFIVVGAATVIIVGAWGYTRIIKRRKMRL